MFAVTCLWENFITAIVQRDFAEDIFEIRIVGSAVFLRIFQPDISSLRQINSCTLPIPPANIAFPICSKAGNAKNMVCKTVSVQVCGRFGGSLPASIFRVAQKPYWQVALFVVPRQSAPLLHFVSQPA